MQGPRHHMLSFSKDSNLIRSDPHTGACERSGLFWPCGRPAPELKGPIAAWCPPSAGRFDRRTFPSGRPCGGSTPVRPFSLLRRRAMTGAVQAQGVSPGHAAFSGTDFLLNGACMRSRLKKDDLDALARRITLSKAGTPAPVGRFAPRSSCGGVAHGQVQCRARRRGSSSPVRASAPGLLARETRRRQDLHSVKVPHRDLLVGGPVRNTGFPHATWRSQAGPS